MKRKVLTLALASTMALGNIIPAFANASNNSNDQNNTTEKTYIETAIGFMYPEESEALHKKNLKATLSGNNKNVEIPLSEMLSNNNNNISNDGLDITLEKIEEKGKIKTIKFKINGLEAADNYVLNVEGKIYLKTTINLSTTTFSKRVNISTQNNMILGDVNNDNKIDENDVKLLEENLHSTNSDYDINGDGVVSIADIAIVNNNMVEASDPTVFDTEMVASKAMEKVEIATLENSVNVVPDGGAIENIFKENEVVKLAPKKDEKIVSIPLEFKEVQEMSSVSITLPDGTPEENVVIKVLDEQNNEITVAKNLSELQLMSSRNNGTVVTVNLGKRVPVKKVVIEVTPTETGYVVVDKVSFLKDVVDENIIDNTKVTNIKTVAGNESVTLSWREVPNVTGYKVYYGESEDNLNKVEVTDKTTVTIDGLKNLTTYYFQVSATSEGWEGQKSDIVSAIPQPSIKPNKPTFLQAEGGDSSIKISWGKTENATAYDVYAKKEEEAEFKKVAENVEKTEATITGLENDKKYILYVVAKNDVVE
ncbi:MAG: fibronectin type III domain-containing protein, partial [Eubacteriales bacterium]|nr:fibronectin type III domain-containing protein [Eubacteriales bacterium]